MGTQNYEGILQRPDKGQLLACENREAACEELSQRAKRVSLIGLLGAISEPIVFCLAFSMMTYLRTNMNTDTKEIGYKTVAKLPEYLLYVVQAQAQPEKLTTTQIMWVLQA